MKRETSPPQIQGRLALALAALDEPSRLLLELYLRGLSLTAIAVTVGLPEPQLAADLADAIDRVRARLVA